MSRIIAIVFLLIFATACSSNKDGMTGSGNLSDKIADNYSMAEDNVEPFTLIKGDEEAGVRAGDRVFFEFDSSSLSSRAQKTLDKQAKWLKSRSNTSVVIEGHADERGTREYNLALGERRANAVKNYLVSSGVSAAKISVVSYGKERPAVVGSSAMAHAENRRAVTVPDNL